MFNFILQVSNFSAEVTPNLLGIQGCFLPLEQVPSYPQVDRKRLQTYIEMMWGSHTLTYFEHGKRIGDKTLKHMSIYKRFYTRISVFP